jgi:enoyl-CoA hydratase/carnithine racemase
MNLVDTHIENKICTITLNRADKKNALTRSMYQNMADTINGLALDSECKVLVIRANGDSFCAGNDIQDFANGEEGQHIAEVVAFMQALLHCKLPVIAEVSGLAVGIGTTMLLHCDLVYCSEGTKFILPFINLGLVPEYASSYILPRIAGHRKASEWLLLGKPIDAKTAYTFGLVTEVLEGQDLSAMVAKTAKELTQKPMFSLMQTKALLKNDADNIQRHMNTELDVFLEAMTTDAAQEAFSAFLHKRPINPEKFT